VSNKDDRRRFPLAFDVVETTWVTRAMRRVVLTGADDTAFATFMERDNGFTDRYVKLLFCDPNTTYPDPFDMEEIRATLPTDVWPVSRTYTVRWIDREAQTIAIDFVVHGDTGYAAPWATRAIAGDRIHLFGPGGAYAPATEPDWHLIAGDDAALPAIGAALEAMPDGRHVRAFIEVDSAEDEQHFVTTADLDITWLHRNGAAPGSTTLIADAVRALDWPDGRAQVFIHGESGLLKALRSHLLEERGVERTDLSFSGYWRRGTNEEGFREWKAAQAKAGVA